MGIMAVNQQEYALTVVKKSQLVILDLEIWAMKRLEISLGVKNADNMPF